MANKGSNGSTEHARTESHPHPPFPAKKLEKPGLESELEPKPRYEAPTYKPAGKLAGKRALITGGDSGIGRAVAVIFAREGADVAINYLPEEQEDAEHTKQAVEAAGKRCILLPGDLADAALCKRLVEDTVKQLGGIDILVSNAAHQNRKKLEDLTPEEFDRTMKVNVYAYYHLAQAVVPHMKPGSAILATSSSTGYRASEDLPDYSATKGAINQFTKALAKQLVEKGIRVNAVAPGPVWTPLNPADEGLSPKNVSTFGEQTPMERPAQPEEVAPAYVFLASEADSSFITGIILPVLGGETMERSHGILRAMADSDEMFKNAGKFLRKLGGQLKDTAQAAGTQIAQTTKQVTGLGRGTVKLELDQVKATPGGTIVGRVVLALSEPVDAKRLVVSLRARQKHLTVKRDASGKTVGTSHADVYQFERELGGAKRYESETVAFELVVPPDALDLKAGAPTSPLGEVVRTVAAAVSPTVGPVEWQVVAEREIAWGRNLSSDVDLIVA